MKRIQLVIEITVPEGVLVRLEALPVAERDRRLAEWILANWKSRSGSKRTIKEKPNGRRRKTGA